MRLDAASARQRFAGVRVARLATAPDGAHIVPSRSRSAAHPPGSGPARRSAGPVNAGPVNAGPGRPAALRTGPCVLAPCRPGPGDCICSAVDAKPKSSTDLRRLRNIRANPRVAVLADHYEDDWGRLWWVRADGHAAILDDPAAMAPALALLAARYPQYRDQPPVGPVISIRVDRWTGWAAGTGRQAGTPERFRLRRR